MNITVTSAAKRPERVAETATAVTVLTQDEIRRSPATTLPELLRTVPGVEVARISESAWAVSIRGFNGRFANKLLVLIDGRSVYTPLFSGVFWDEHDVILDDIERIEIIRGPGAPLWGANAVNGVINIITRSAAETQGRLVKLGTGTGDRALVAARQGGELGPDSHYRLYAKGFQRGDVSGRGPPTWTSGRTGFRTDGQLSEGADWTVLGGAHSGRDDQSYERPVLTPPYTTTRSTTTDVSGAYLLGRWERHVNDANSIRLQGYYDHSTLDSELIRYRRHTLDASLEHVSRPATMHTLVWGLGYRTWWDDIAGGLGMSFAPRTARSEILSGFLQDTVDLVPDRLKLVVGTKVEHDGEDVSLQPTARTLWQVDASSTVWAAVSRAVRTPSRAERTIEIENRALPPASAANPGPFPVMVTYLGSDELEAEKLTAFEVGYRFTPSKSTSLDVAAFYNVYDHLIAARADAPRFAVSPLPHVVAPFRADNGLEGESFGGEVSGLFQATPWWRLRLGYGYLHMSLREKTAGTAQTNANVSGKSPRHQATLQSSMTLKRSATLDLTLRYVDDLPALNVDGYVALDARIGWQPAPGLELAISGQNLLGAHREFGSEAPLASQSHEIGPSVLATARWAF